MKKNKFNRNIEVAVEETLVILKSKYDDIHFLNCVDNFEHVTNWVELDEKEEFDNE